MGTREAACARKLAAVPKEAVDKAIEKTPKLKRPKKGKP